MDFELIARIILMVINAIGLLLAWWVIQSGSKKELKVWFFFMTLFILLWCNFSYLGSRVVNPSLSILLYKLNWASVCLFLVSFYYFFVIEFLRKGKIAKYIGLGILFSSVSLFAISIFSDLVITRVVHQDWGNEITFGPLGSVFNIFSAIVAFIVIFYSLQGYGSLPRDTKLKLRYFLSGIFIFILANLIFNVGSQIVFQSVEYQFLGDFSSIFLLGFTAFATIQHRLFDVKIITTEAVTALLLTILFSRIVVSQGNTLRLVDSAIFILGLIFGILLIRSVKNEVQQKQRLQELTEQLKELDAKKDEFLSIATHELRAPMTAIRGYISMILEGDAGEIPQEANNFLQVVQSSADRLIRLVNNMLNIARIEQGRQVYQMGTVQMTTVVNTIFSEFKLDAQKKGLKYTLEITPEVQDTVYVDQDRIHEVVANLISNAIKYTDAGGVTVKLFNQGSSIRFEVVDTGKGIAPEDQTQLFQKYYRVQDRMERKTGTGLGLYISKILVEKFGGKIGIQTALGHGSTFWFEIPCFSQGQDFPKTAV